MKPRLILAVALFFLAVAASGRAEPYSITPWVKVKQSYSDNILLSSKNETSDAITTVTGGLTLEQNQERLKTKLSGQLEQFCYWDYDDLNALDYSVSGSLKYKLTERLGLNASARYDKDSQWDRDTETTGMVISGDRKTADLFLGLDYMLSELSRIEFSVDLGNTDRQEEYSSNDTSEDNNTIEVNVTFQRDLSEYFSNTVGLFNLKYLHYAGEQESYYELGFWEQTTFQDYDSDVFQFSTGFSHNISELYSLFCQVGASYTKTSENQDYERTFLGFSLPRVSGPEYQTNTWGGVLSTGIDYKDEYWSMGVALSQDVRGATGTRGVVQRTSLSGNLNRKLTSDLTLTFKTSVYMNKNERKSSSDEDTLTYNLQPGVRYRFKNDFFLSGAWRFTSVEDRENDSDKTHNLVYIELKKEFNLKDF